MGYFCYFFGVLYIGIIDLGSGGVFRMILVVFFVIIIVGLLRFLFIMFGIIDVFIILRFFILNIFVLLLIIVIGLFLVFILYVYVG